MLVPASAGSVSQCLILALFACGTEQSREHSAPEGTCQRASHDHEACLLDAHLAGNHCCTAGMRAQRQAFPGSGSTTDECCARLLTLLQCAMSKECMLSEAWPGMTTLMMLCGSKEPADLARRDAPRDAAAQDNTCRGTGPAHPWQKHAYIHCMNHC